MRPSRRPIFSAFELLFLSPKYFQQEVFSILSPPSSV